jgi:hypothetical protein
MGLLQLSCAFWAFSSLLSSVGADRKYFFRFNQAELKTHITQLSTAPNRKVMAFSSFQHTTA